MTGNKVVPFVYEGVEVRTVEQGGKVLFCGKDVAAALGYANTNDALSRHCKGVVKRYPLETAGGTQQVRFITEGDVYRLITHSKLDTAQQFETWVFDEVLPTIHKHGMYATEQAVEAFLANPDALLHTLTALKQAREENQQLAAQVAQAQPKVLFADAVASSHTSILVGELAKILKQNGVDIGQQRLFEWMRNNGYLCKRRGLQWNTPTQAAMERGLFEVKESTRMNPDGTTQIIRTTKVTGKGQQYFIDLFLNGQRVA